MRFVGICIEDVVDDIMVANLFALNFRKLPVCYIGVIERLIKLTGVLPLLMFLGRGAPATNILDLTTLDNQVLYISREINILLMFQFPEQPTDKSLSPFSQISSKDTSEPSLTNLHPPLRARRRKITDVCDISYNTIWQTKIISQSILSLPITSMILFHNHTRCSSIKWEKKVEASEGHHF